MLKSKNVPDNAITRAQTIKFFKNEFAKSTAVISRNVELTECLNTSKISNIVASVNTDVKDINMTAYAQEHFICNYHKPTFAAMGVHLQYPWSTALIYPIGMFVCMGTKSPTQALLACTKYIQVFNRHLGLKCRMTGFQIDNFVYNIYAFPFDLSLCIREEWAEVIEYDPTKFPGATVRCELMDLPFYTAVVVTLFELGKVNITGSKCYEEAMFMFIIVYFRYIQHIRRRNNTSNRPVAAVNQATANNSKRNKRNLDPKMQPVLRANLIVPKVPTNEQEMERLKQTKRTFEIIEDEPILLRNQTPLITNKRLRIETPEPFEDIDKILLAMGSKTNF